jgi:NitT/TauT family transport system ATP-binding protein
LVAVEKKILYHLAEQLLLEVDDLLPIIEGATLLGFATAREGDVKITPEGKAFAEADISTRKLLFREAALTRVALLQKIMQRSKASRIMLCRSNFSTTSWMSTSPRRKF